VQLVYIDTIHTEIAQAAVQLILQKARRHAMAARDDIFGNKNSWLNVFAEEIIIWIGGHRAVWREVAAFGANHHFFAWEAFFRELFDGGADAAFALLESIVDSGVDYVDPAFDGRDGRGGVAFVSLCVGLAEIRADSDGRERESLRLAEMASRSAARESPVR
jgi:hypothetical protein